MFVTLSTVAVTSVRAVNNLTTTHHAACPPALLLASAHASACLRVSPALTAGARHVSPVLTVVVGHVWSGHVSALDWVRVQH